MSSPNDRRFAGLMDVDWAGLRHAYGPADEVPKWVWELVDDEPSVRQSALDAFYAAVHHQGHVNDCTVACMPFLVEAALDPAVPDRGDLLELLASICGTDYGQDCDLAAAHAVIGAHWQPLSGLLSDPEPAVRVQAPGVLTGCPQLWPATTRVLIEHYRTETDRWVRCAVVQALGGIDSGEARQWLGGLCAAEPDPVVRLRAWAALALLDPASLAPSTVEDVLHTVDRCYETDTHGPAPAPEGPRPTETLIGYARHMSAMVAAGQRVPEVTGFLYEIDEALDARVGERIALAVGLLEMPHWEARAAACSMAMNLVTFWRSDDYGPLVLAVARRLRDPQPRVVDAALGALVNFGPLAAPAADGLAELLESQRPATPGNELLPTVWESLLATQAELRHPLALATIERLVQDDDPPRLWSWLEEIHPLTESLLPLLCRRLRELRAAGEGRHNDQVRAIAAGIGRLGPNAADAVPVLADLLPTTAHPWTFLDALGGIGPAAQPALPAIRPFLRHPDNRLAVAAARAWWRICADPEPLLELALSALDSKEPGAGARLAAEIAPHAAPALPHLRRMIADGDEVAWTRAQAAIALWRITGQAQPTVGVLLDAVQRNEFVADDAVPCFAAIGPTAREALPLLHRILADPRRAEGRIGVPPVRGDLALLEACREAVASIDRPY